MTHDEQRAANEAVVTAYLDAVSTLDLEAMAATMHPEVTLVQLYAPEGIPPTVEGKDAVVEFMSGIPDFVTPLNFHDRKIEPLLDPDEFVVEYKSDSSVKATGKPYRNVYISRFSFRDGLIVRFAEYFNPLILLAATGATIVAPDPA